MWPRRMRRTDNFSVPLVTDAALTREQASILPDRFRTHREAHAASITAFPSNYPPT